MIAKGIIHCHSNLSYDSVVTLDDLCSTLSRDGLHFVALTEHTRGIRAADYQAYVKECQQYSSASFILVPGLEVCCEDGIEIAGIGLGEFVGDGPVSQVVAEVRQRGGFALWVHPTKRGVAPTTRLDCDAWEVLNGKTDGTIAPDLRLLSRLRAYSENNSGPHAVFGLDLHSLEPNRSAWVECDVSDLTTAAIVAALREGRFINRTACVALPSSGTTPVWNYLWLALARSMYLGWNWVLEVAPKSARSLLISVSRRGVAWIHRGPH